MFVNIDQNGVALQVDDPVALLLTRRHSSAPAGVIRDFTMSPLTTSFAEQQASLNVKPGNYVRPPLAAFVLLLCPVVYAPTRGCVPNFNGHRTSK